MAATSKPVNLNFGALEFSLPATDGKTYSFADIVGERGTVIAFICNHCPYVKAVAGRMVEQASELMEAGIGFAAICSNDAERYPEDSLGEMAKFAQSHGFAFPYMQDESQETARAFDAACTPEFYGFDADNNLVYHGRLDEGRIEPPGPGARRELMEAMQAAAAGQAVPATSLPAMGCSIKWKPS